MAVDTDRGPPWPGSTAAGSAAADRYVSRKNPPSTGCGLSPSSRITSSASSMKTPDSPQSHEVHTKTHQEDIHHSCPLCDPSCDLCAFVVRLLHSRDHDRVAAVLDHRAVAERLEDHRHHGGRHLGHDVVPAAAAEQVPGPLHEQLRDLRLGV